ncbi:hypothetical protein SCP_0904710 [Sparassis crispa]|uniref:Uncharacterized protein n=1 Tax=Sparassis crispa TaxID=139825 RepID=A0A401GWN6_9APHY|nr:hypothetical protein SCP_0904710 [Sparassis crispa]GBE86592.1 hypothetical protein SCP_0904710 [Sparassis crispa]
MSSRIIVSAGVSRELVFDNVVTTGSSISSLTQPLLSPSSSSSTPPLSSSPSSSIPPLSSSSALVYEALTNRIFVSSATTSLGYLSIITMVRAATSTSSATATSVPVGAIIEGIGGGLAALAVLLFANVSPRHGVHVVQTCAIYAMGLISFLLPGITSWPSK